MRKQLRGREAVALSIFVSQEQHVGLVRAGSERLRRQAELVLAELPVLPRELPSDAHHAEIRYAPEDVVVPIGANDLRIAAHAHALGATLMADSLGVRARPRAARRKLLEP